MMNDGRKKEELRKVAEALARAKIPHAEAEMRWWHAMRQLSVIVDELDKNISAIKSASEINNRKGNRVKNDKD